MFRGREADSASCELPGQARHAGLDWIRALGAVAVIVLHAGIAYLTVPMPGLVWPAQHPVPSPAVNAVFWGIEACVMPLFLMLSGYVSWRSLRHRGRQEFVRQRVQRILFPLLAFGAIILPIELYLWMLGWVGNGELSWRDFRDLRLGARKEHLWGLSHLWYLEYVFLYSLLLAAAVRIQEWQRNRSEARATVPLSLPGGPWTLVAVLGALWLVLAWQPAVILGFQHGFLPFPSKFLYCGLFFAWGVAEANRPFGRNSAVWRQPALWLGSALVLFPAYLQLVGGQLSDQPLWLRTTLLLGLCSSLTFGCWSLCERLQAAPPPAVRYLAAASFWIYLVHHPLVPLFQIRLSTTGWSAPLQFAVSALGTLVLSLASYEVFVRTTVIGRFLSGRGVPEPATSPSPAQRAIRRAA